ncbi:hypothetical protein MM326_06815 [Alkalihalobacillus sp. LMS6]|uniref:hypothetical protein n=1 Tax=Alkalihalobacillus sp. LMS6 TaxID=2924034 RepID=UPI0020D1C8BC|nr:hypothetical protein [Alkalihalobacillus sp. LMS6]UTR07719.1 hypothetical protein MM326_06815 [Alkalihalobacillus sp. LMS6]
MEFVGKHFDEIINDEYVTNKVTGDVEIPYHQLAKRYDDSKTDLVGLYVAGRYDTEQGLYAAKLYVAAKERYMRKQAVTFYSFLTTQYKHYETTLKTGFTDYAAGDDLLDALEAVQRMSKYNAELGAKAAAVLDKVAVLNEGGLKRSEQEAIYAEVTEIIEGGAE